jgi:hypothetical protein
MKTAEKLAAGWLLTLGFMFMTLSVSAAVEKNTMLKPIPPGIDNEAPDYINNDALYVLDITAKQGLIFGVPTLILGGWLSLNLYRKSREENKALSQQTRDRLQSVFYQILQENNGRVTLLSFAMQSQLPAIAAKDYLDERAKEFNANFKVSEEGSVSYHFDI